MGRIPEWLEPYLRANSYNPIKEDIVNLEPQSREEMLLKYIALYSSGGEMTMIDISLLLMMKIL